jgi:twitching motility protein PilT
MLAESLKGVICQQLLRKTDGKGRLAALEILICNAAVSNLIREGKTFQVPSIMQTARGEGMQMMDQHIMELLKAKHVSGEEAYRCALDKKAFEPFLGPVRKY